MRQVRVPHEYRQRGAVGIDYIYTFAISSFVLVAITIFTLAQLEVASREYSVDLFQENADAIARAVDDALVVHQRNPDATYQVEVEKRTSDVNFEVIIVDRIVYLNSTGTAAAEEITVNSRIRHNMDINVNGTFTNRSFLWYVVYNNNTIHLMDRPLSPDEFAS